MKRILALFLVLLSMPATATDLRGPRNRSSGGKQCMQASIAGVMTDLVCADGTTGGVRLHGRTDGGTAASGDIGQVVTTGSTVALTTSTTNLGSITPGPGTWNVSAMITTTTTATVLYMTTAIVQTSLAPGTIANQCGFAIVFVGGGFSVGGGGFSVNNVVVTAGSPTIYLTGSAGAAIPSGTSYTLSATRVN